MSVALATEPVAVFPSVTGMDTFAVEGQRIFDRAGNPHAYQGVDGLGAVRVDGLRVPAYLWGLRTEVVMVCGCVAVNDGATLNLWSRQGCEIPARDHI